MSYRDTMDPSRVLVPVTKGLTQWRCKIYFSGVYAGQADVPVSLIGNPDIGFIENPAL